MRRHARRVLTSVPDVPDTSPIASSNMALLDAFPLPVREALKTSACGFNLEDMPKIAKSLKNEGVFAVLDRIRRIDADFRRDLNHQYNTMVIDILRNKKPR